MRVCERLSDESASSKGQNGVVRFQFINDPTFGTLSLRIPDGKISQTSRSELEPDHFQIRDQIRWQLRLAGQA